MKLTILILSLFASYSASCQESSGKCVINNIDQFYVPQISWWNSKSDDFVISNFISPQFKERKSYNYRLTKNESKKDSSISSFTKYDFEKLEAVHIEYFKRQKIGSKTTYELTKSDSGEVINIFHSIRFKNKLVTPFLSRSRYYNTDGQLESVTLYEDRTIGKHGVEKIANIWYYTYDNLGVISEVKKQIINLSRDSKCEQTIVYTLSPTNNGYVFEKQGNTKSKIQLQIDSTACTITIKNSDYKDHSSNTYFFDINGRIKKYSNNYIINGEKIVETIIYERNKTGLITSEKSPNNAGKIITLSKRHYNKYNLIAKLEYLNAKTGILYHYEFIEDN